MKKIQCYAFLVALLCSCTTNANRQLRRQLKSSADDSTQASNPSDSTGSKPGNATVVGGTDADRGEFPFFVHFGDLSCGGTLISPNRVLTAAHCIDDGVPCTVRVGGRGRGDGTLARVRCGTIHPDWDSNRPFVNDIAILKLCGNVRCGPESVTLNTDTTIPSGGTAATLIGMGQTTAGGPTNQGSLILQKMTYSTISDEDCVAIWGGRIVANLSVCAQNTETKGACFGDSGGPLLDSSKKLQLGLVSGGAGRCASGGSPDVYTDVAAYADWIEEQKNSDSCDGGCLQNFLRRVSGLGRWAAEETKAVVSHLQNSL